MIDWLQRLWQRIQRQEWVQRLIGRSFVAYYRLVVASSRVTVDPPDYAETIAPLRPFVGALWHGESLMMPFPLQISRWSIKAMTSRSRDGGIIAAVLEATGIGPIRASGGRTTRRTNKRGGAVGLIQARDALRQGSIVCMTADIPKGKAYVVGPGIIALARHGDCPIIPIAAVTSSQIRFSSWDKMAFALPFGRIHVQFGTPISVPEAADEAAMTATQQTLQAEMDRVHAVAYAAVGCPDKVRVAAGAPA